MELNGIECEVSYRRVRYARLEMKAGRFLMILPPGHDPKAFLEKNRNWIERKKKLFAECLRDSADQQVRERTEAEFRESALALMSGFSRELGVMVDKVSFRNMKSKWGSCIPKKGKITLNTRLQYLPDRLLQYIVFHEVAHLLERRHDQRFWKLIEAKFSDYREFRKELVLYQLKIENMS